MGKYADMAARGRAAAHETNQQRRVTVERYEWREAPTTYGHWVEPCPPFTTERQWRVEQNGTHWEILVIGDCGHQLSWLAYGIPHEGFIPARYQYAWPIGKRTRCAACPPREPKAAPPDEERCTYTWDTEFEEDKRCRTRARWSVFHATPDGKAAAEPHQRICEKHRRQLVESGHILPEPRPEPYGYTDGGFDVCIEIPRVRAGRSGAES